MDIDKDSQPPKSSSSSPAPNVEDDFDIDTFVREEEERLARMRAASSSVSVSAAVSSPATKAVPRATYKAGAADEAEEAMWDAVNGVEDVISSTSDAVSKLVQAPVHEDEDMWDLMNDGPGPSDAPYVPPPVPAIVEGGSEGGGGGGNVQAHEGGSVSRRPTNDEDWDDMYL